MIKRFFARIASLLNGTVRPSDPDKPTEMPKDGMLHCPVCGGVTFRKGPGGGDGMCVLCVGCGQEYNYHPVTGIYRWVSPRSAYELRQIYGDDLPCLTSG